MGRWDQANQRRAAAKQAAAATAAASGAASGAAAGAKGAKKSRSMKKKGAQAAEEGEEEGQQATGVKAEEEQRGEAEVEVRPISSASEVSKGESIAVRDKVSAAWYEAKVVKVMRRVALTGCLLKRGRADSRG